jgi:hypothetical protein
MTWNGIVIPAKACTRSAYQLHSLQADLPALWPLKCEMHLGRQAGRDVVNGGFKSARGLENTVWLTNTERL